MENLKWNYRDIKYGPDANQDLDIIIPNRKIVHAIVYIHGGAYYLGDKYIFPSFLADYSERCILATINYRLFSDNY